MASYFGEINPLYSRAVDDEEADNQPNYAVFIEKINETNLDLNIKLIFSVDEVAATFVKSHFLLDNSVLISTIKCEKEETEDDSTFYTGMRSYKNIRKVIASIYKSNKDTVVCNISYPVPEETCVDITDLIFKTFSPSEVLILTSQHMSTYKVENNATYELPFLKALGTSIFMADNKCRIPRLQPPNFLSNISASLLLKCEISKISALCAVNYIDTNAIDSLNVKVFDDILKESIVSKLVVNHDANERVIRYVKGKSMTASNLYT